jgi:tRNA pseudouridine synthase 8/2,5-diamino-6-(5-phospho-D-ribitylamino)-pyrimidin-4(3H)-one deaminase
MTEAISNKRHSTNPHRDQDGFRLKQHDIDALNNSTIQDDAAEGAKYIIDGRLRRVPPYYFTHLTYCKQRWMDRNILEVFVNEFRDRDEQYYVST